MEYLKINNTDYSNIVNELTVARSVNYSAQTNAAGNTVVDYINFKRKISVGFIPLNDAKMKQLLTDVNAFNVSLHFRNPDTNEIETANCIVTNAEISFYTIQVGNVLYKPFSIDFVEL
jgi:hypothetical protein